MAAPQPLQDFKVPVKLRLSGLWASVMFCYIYCDFFTLFVPGHIQSLMDGESGVGATTPVKLLLFALMMSIPSAMVFLALALKPVPSRWTNFTLGICYTVIMVLIVTTSTGEWLLFYTYMGIVEIILTLIIVWQAWNWPREGGQADKVS